MERYIKEQDKIYCTEVGKAQLVARIKEKNGDSRENLHNDSFKRGKSSPSLSKSLRLAFVAVPILLLLIAFAIKMGYFDIYQLVGADNIEKQLKLAQTIQVIDEKVVRDSGTLHFKEVLGDDHVIYIICDFIAPEGTVLQENYSINAEMNYIIDYENLPENLNDMSLSNYSCWHSLEDEDETDNMRTFVYEITNSGGFPPLDMSIFVYVIGIEKEFPEEEGLWGQIYDAEDTLWASGAYDENRILSKEGQEVLNEIYDKIYQEYYAGNWGITLSLEYESFSTSYEMEELISIDHLEADFDSFPNLPDIFLNKISISPLNISFHFEIDSHYYPEAISEVFYEEPFVINYTDGSSEKVVSNHGSSSFGGNKIGMMRHMYNYPSMCEKEVYSIVFMEKEYVLSDYAVVSES